MIKLFNTCDVLQYCLPPKEPEPQKDEWLVLDTPKNINNSWIPLSRRTSSTVRAIPSIYPNHLTQNMKRYT